MSLVLSYRNVETLENPIEVYIHRRQIGEEVIQEPLSQCVLRRTLKIAGGILAFSGNIPFIQVNLQAGGNSILLGSLLVYGTTTSYTFLISWALNDMIDDYLRPISVEERQLISVKKINRCGQIAIFGSSIIIGLISQFPIAWFAFSANETGWFPPILMPIATLLSDSWLSVYSCKLSFDALLERRKLSEIETKMEHIREEILLLIEENKNLLASGSKGQAIDYAHAISEFRASSQENAITKFCELMIERRTETSQKVTKKGKMWNVCTTVIGGVIATTQMFMLGYLSYLGASSLGGDSAINLGAAALAVGANVWLQGKAIVGTAKRVCNAVKNSFLRIFRPSLCEKLSPKLTFLLKGFMLITAMLSWGPSVQMTASFASVNEFLRIYLGSAFSIGTFLLISTATLDIADNIMTYTIERFGDAEAKLLIAVNKKMNQLQDLLRKSPLIEYAKFLKILPQHLLDQILERFDVSMNALDEYIQTHANSHELRPLLQQRVSIVDE